MMDTWQLSEEVLFTRRRFTTVTRDDLELLKDQASRTRRKRIRLCAHPDVTAAVHEMFIVQPQGAYVRPHKHRGKDESFLLIEGAATVVVFGEDQAVQEVIPMGTVASGRPFYHRMPADVYHTVLIESEVVVYHEATSGPFRKADMVAAPWAPQEEDEAAVSRFMADLQESVG